MELRRGRAREGELESFLKRAEMRELCFQVSLAELTWKTRARRVW
jgi:hypothetical protein